MTERQDRHLAIALSALCVSSHGTNHKDVCAIYWVQQEA